MNGFIEFTDEMNFKQHTQDTIRDITSLKINIEVPLIEELNYGRWIWENMIFIKHTENNILSENNDILDNVKVSRPYIDDWDGKNIRFRFVINNVNTNGLFSNNSPFAVPINIEFNLSDEKEIQLQ